MRSLIDSRLTILAIAMLVGVLGLQLLIYSVIQVNTRAILEIYAKQFDRWIELENTQYRQYKKERDEDFNDFTTKTISLLSSTLQKIQVDEDRILSNQNAQLQTQTSKIESTINDAAKKVEDAPRVIEHTHTVEHHTEIISDAEVKRRDKLKQQWDQYRQKKADWEAKYGRKSRATENNRGKPQGEQNNQNQKNP